MKMGSSLEGDCFFSIKEAAEISGLSKNTLLMASGLPHYQPTGERGKILIKKSELFNWIERSRIQEVDLDMLCRKVLESLRKKKSPAKKEQASSPTITRKAS